MSDWSSKEIDSVAELARALGHPARVRILRELLQQGECIGGELADSLPLAASTVSQHLKILKQAGLIVGRVDGPRRCYCVDEQRLAGFSELLDALMSDVKST